MSAKLHLAAGSTADGPYSLAVTPEQAGWTYSGLRVLDLPAGGEQRLDTGEDEVIVLPLSGSCRVAVDGEQYDLAGRPSVFAGPSDLVYASRDATVAVTTVDGGRFALCTARASRRLPPRYVPAADVPLLIRGTGNCSRQVHNFGFPGALDADRIIAVEVITPAGNWSSYPPHKHEQDRLPIENDLEEVYAYRFEAPEAFGVQRLYSRAGDLDETWTVRDLDVLLVPRGYHPFCAAHGYHGYYLNALAAEKRSMAAEDDPDLAWTRDAWPGMTRDPRVPITGKETA